MCIVEKRVCPFLVKHMLACCVCVFLKKFYELIILLIKKFKKPQISGLSTQLDVRNSLEQNNEQYYYFR